MRVRVSSKTFALVTVVLLGATSGRAQLALRPAKVVARDAKNVRFLTHDTTEGDTNEDKCKDFTVTPGWHPTDHDAQTALCFWDLKNQEYVKFGQLVSSAKNMSIATEIVADAFSGVRVGLSTAVAATTDNSTPAAGSKEPTSDQDRVLNLLASNGGNLAVTGSYPIYYKPFEPSKGATDQDTGWFLWNTFVRAAANMSAFGGQTTNTQKFSDVDGNIEFAVADIHAELFGHAQRINLLGYLKTSGIIGTGKYAQSLSDKASKAFVHGQVGAGLRVGEVLMLFAGYNWYSDGAIPGRGATLTVVVGK